MFMDHCNEFHKKPDWAHVRVSADIQAIKQFMMTTIEETLKHDLIARLTAPTPKTEYAHCMTCGHGLEPGKAAKGGRARFCSDRCLMRDGRSTGPPLLTTPPGPGLTR
jgi:hypothetical protein